MTKRKKFSFFANRKAAKRMSNPKIKTARETGKIMMVRK